MQDYTALKDVLGICRSTEQGFRGAANSVRTPALCQIFEEYSQQRGRFAGELLQAARSQGLHLDDPAGVPGLLHGVWMEMIGAFSGHNEHQILEEASRAEEHSVRIYRQAQRMSLSDEVRGILERQAAEVEAAQARLRTLCEATAGETDERSRRAY
jgi:uncharacterized protein (TIGR02284 family)